MNINNQQQQPKTNNNNQQQKQQQQSTINNNNNNNNKVLPSSTTLTTLNINNFPSPLYTNTHQSHEHGVTQPIAHRINTKSRSVWHCIHVGAGDVEWDGQGALHVRHSSLVSAGDYSDLLE